MSPSPLRPPSNGLQGWLRRLFDPQQGRAAWHPLRRKIVVLAILPLIASMALIAWAVKQQAQELGESERTLVESAYLKHKEAELRDALDLALSLVQPIYDRAAGQGPEVEARAQEEAKRIFDQLRFGSADGYFFVYDYQGTCLVLPPQPELVGQNLWEVRDPNGVAVVQALVGVARQGRGTFRYIWNKPSNRQPAPKLSLVVGLQRWGWMMGTGIYLDDVQATLDQLRVQRDANIRKTSAWIAAIAVLAVVLVGGSALALNLSETRAADAQLKLLAQQVVQSQEVERAHLSRELHDSTSQTLVSVKFLMDSGLRQLHRQEVPVPPTLTQARLRVDDALSEVRHISHRLRPALLDTLGLPAALRQMGEEYVRSADLEFHMHEHGSADALPDAVKTVLFRVTQEALTNIGKHAQATRVDLHLIRRPVGVRLTVIDDGEGFNVAEVLNHPRSGIGLRNMRERLETVGGRLKVSSRPGLTRVQVDIPAQALTASA